TALSLFEIHYVPYVKLPQFCHSNTLKSAQHLCRFRKGTGLSAKRDGAAVKKGRSQTEFHYVPENYILSWQVLAITSSCCSLVRSMNFTAYPDTRIVKFAYSSFSGCSIASISFSVPNTFTFR